MNSDALSGEAIDSTSFPGGHSVWVPPDPISNSEVKPFCADDSVGPPHVKVGHRRVYTEKPLHFVERLFFGRCFDLAEPDPVR